MVPGGGSLTPSRKDVVTCPLLGGLPGQPDRASLFIIIASSYLGTVAITCLAGTTWGTSAPLSSPGCRPPAALLGENTQPGHRRIPRSSVDHAPPTWSQLISRLLAFSVSSAAGF